VHSFMYWEHNDSMFSLHPLFIETEREHYLEVELMAGGNSPLKRIL